jgi:formamidopyrimidine-DNA glycosylase
MPELPEVEANARNLARVARGRTVRAVTPPPGRRELGGLAGRAFARRIAGRKFLDVTRRGKWILCKLDGGAGLALHLGMTGKIAAAGTREPLPRFTRAVFTLDGGRRVCFVDARRFGKLLAAPYDRLLERPEIATVGPDALRELTAAQLGDLLAATRRTVKAVLLDQTRLAGVGNLYATEALWRARIHPATAARQLDRAAIRALHRGLRAALDHGLRTYAAEEVPEYIEEGAPNPFHAYDRAGLPCHRCRTPLAKMVLGGRTSAFCPRCQPAAR